MREIKEVPALLNSNYFPSLDGFRALAVILVVTYHLALVVHSHVYYFFINGPLGVDIFFVISGFLITTLLLKEKVSTGSISLRKFYFRRVLRIFPAAYSCLIVIIGISLVFGFAMDRVNLLGCFLYLTDFPLFGLHHTSWATGHYWSLAIEEQYYLLFPFLLKTNQQVYTYVLLFILVVLPGYFIAASYFPGMDTPFLHFPAHFLIKFQGIAIGSLTSMLLFARILAPDKWTINGYFLTALNILLIWAIFSSGYDPKLSVASVFKNGLTSLLVAGLLLVNVFIPRKNIVYGLLNIRPMKYIGVMSYSIYIWHMLFTDEQYRPFPAWFYSRPFVYVPIFVAAFLSYTFIEKPFLRWKRRYYSGRTQMLR